MKKRFLSTLLLGALVVASTSMITSCKDYDDDINANTTEINDLKSQLSTLESALEEAEADATTAHATFATTSDLEALETEIASLATADALQEAIDSLEALIDGKVDQTEYDTKVAELEALIDGIDSNLNTLSTSLDELETAQEAANNNIELQQTALENLQTALNEGLASKANQTEVDSLKQQVADLLDEIKNLSGDNSSLSELKQQMQDLDEKVSAVSTEIDVLTVFVKHALASLTFIPDYFTEGIEAALVPAYKGAYSTTSDDTTFTTAGSSDDLLSGYGIARYNVSPTSVDLVGSKVDFYSLASTVLTRAGEDYIAPVDTELTSAVVAENYENGILSVPFKADYDKISALDDDQLPIAALQVSRGDTTVTSDYATFIAKEFSGMVVADNGVHNAVITAEEACPQGTDGLYHLFTAWSDVKTANTNITHNVAYDGHLNLDSIAEVHVTDEDDNERTLSADELEALGLKIVFEKVDYDLGTNETSESAHIELLANEDSQIVAYPRNVDEDGETITGTTANKASIGRQPIIIAKVVDISTGEKVYAWGYIKIKITSPSQAISAITTSAIAFNDDVYANCTGGPYEFKTTWSQIESKVYSFLNISKVTFENTYELDDNTDDAKQYFINNGTYAELTDKYGTVSEVQDEDDPTTNILCWSFTEAQLNALQSLDTDGDGVSDDSLTIYVRFKLQGSTDEYDGVYVPLTIPAGKLHWAVASVSGSKVLAQWYQLNSSNNATSSSDAKEVRINVPVPTTSDNELTTDEFTRDLHNYFLNNSLSYTLNDSVNFSNLKASTTNKLVFKFINPSTTTGNATFDVESDSTWTVTGVSGSVYSLEVSSNSMAIQIVEKDGSSVTATDIVTLDTDGNIKFIESEMADDILNYMGHNELGERETFTAYIGMSIDGTCYTVPLSGETWFNVRFLRPVDLTQPEPYTIKDAPNEWQTINVDSLVKVYDYRGYVGDPTNSNGGADQGNLFDFVYYGIELSTDSAEVYTDAYLGVNDRTILTDATSIEKLYKTSNIPGLLIQYGSTTSQLQYKNSSAITGTFHLYVPVKMTYVFGQTPQTLYSVVTVTKSEGQNTAKKN